MNGSLNVLSLLLTALLSFIPGLGWLTGSSAAVGDDAQTVRRTLQWPAGAEGRVFELSNTNGPVRIVVEERGDVSIVATRRVVREGRSGVAAPEMDFRQESGRVVACGDASHCGCHVDWPRDSRRGDERPVVRVEFEVRVPRATTLDVCAVNGGTLSVDGADGAYTLRNVNGGLEMTRMRGSGEASTVNGNVEATFAAAPSRPSLFRTVNGRVNVTLPGTLSADLRLKTLHGGLYTDFDTTPLPTRASAERRGGRLVFRPDRHASVRVGSGGPELTFETINGDVEVRKQK